MPEVTLERPELVKDEHLEYLDELRLSGVTNMYGAGTYLMQSFPLLTREEARSILKNWMTTFGERHCTPVTEEEAK